jgi:hypothetical protein
MNEKQLFIPDKIKVGYCNREDTYTKKLAYVIYFDKKGVLRKEKSWETWRDKKITPDEFTNEPTEGFVLNKGVGGSRASYGWNARNEYIRVYDPRGFEFEISVANLLFILREGDCSRGKGLEGKFCYAWDGTELVLLPCASQDFKNSQVFTNLQDKTVHVKNMIEGATYTTRRQEDLVYLGRFNYFYLLDNPDSKDKGVCKKFVFWNGKDFEYFNDLKSFAVCKSDTVHPDYADLVDKYNKSPHGSKIAKLFLKPGKREENGYKNYFYFEDTDGSFVGCQVNFCVYNKPESGIDYIQTNSKNSLKDGILLREQYSVVAVPGDWRKHRLHTDRRNWWGQTTAGYTFIDYRPPTDLQLWAIFESGTEIQLNYQTLMKGR